MTVTKKRNSLREVIHISTIVGDHGGEAWCLQLSCGHSTFRRKPSARHLVQNLFRPLSFFLAPKRAKCYFCSKVLAK